MIAFWPPLSPFPRGLPREQAHDSDQRDRSRTGRLLGVCAKRGHLDADLASRAKRVAMAGSTLVLVGVQNAADTASPGVGRVRDTDRFSCGLQETNEGATRETLIIP